MTQGYLLRAGVDLLRRSGLLRWDEVSDCFGPLRSRPSSGEFAKHGPFGRLICWILFSIGAEYVLKAVCQAHGVACPTKKRWNVEYPQSGQVKAWARLVATRSGAEKVEGAPVSEEFYGPLEKYNGQNGHIGRLAEKLSLQVDDQQFLIAGYKLLTAIRNRDVHSYVRDVREENFYLVGELFIPCLNILWDTLPPDVKSSVDPARTN